MKAQRALLVLYVVLWALFQVVAGQSYPAPHRCSNRLENALEHMRRRSAPTKSTRSMWDQPLQSPYQLYHSIYGQQDEPEDDFYSGGGGGSGGGRGYYAKHIVRRQGRPYPFNAGGGGAGGGEELEDLLATSQPRQPHKLAISRVEVEDLKVRVPPGKAASRWVEIDKCKFSTENSTLDTRLIFPDLTLSGKVVMQPTGGRCHMILRLRHAGIEFRTVPIGFDGGHAATHEQSRRLSAASVRTDSHFAEPGFISVFAHGCQGPSGIRLRQNSKRRFSYAGGETSAPQVELGEPHVVMGTAASTQRWGKYHKPDYDIRSGYHQAAASIQRDQRLNFNRQPTEEEIDSREYFDVNGDNFYRRQFNKRRRRRRRRRRELHGRQQFDEDKINFSDDVLNFADDHLQQLVEPDARAFADIFGDQQVGDAMSNELEKLFSMGVRGLLTTYMQRALQPAIKETLMENMGYTLSYG